MNYRVLHCSRFFYLDRSNGAAIANKTMMECLSRCGFEVQVLSGTVVDTGFGGDPYEYIREHKKLEISEILRFSAATSDVPSDGARLRAVVKGVPVTVLRHPLKRYGEIDSVEAEEFLYLLERMFEGFQPDVLVTYGGDSLTLEILTRARRRRITTVFTLHNFAYNNISVFKNVDNVIVASRFSAEYHRRTIGIECTVLPNLVDYERIKPEICEPKYVTFVNPSLEKGVFVFAQIADEMGRRRPDIPLLVVESRGTEATLVACGIDLREHGNVFLMSQTQDPRQIWNKTRICLMPSLWWENQPLVAVEAMINGVPVIGSDRGGVPETVGESGIILSLPDRLTAATRMLPTVTEIEPWIGAIIGLWDDDELYCKKRNLALAEARRWDQIPLEHKYKQFFKTVGSFSKASPSCIELRAGYTAVVPRTEDIGLFCEKALTELEMAGVRVVRGERYTDADLARNVLISEGLRDGSDSILVIDPIIGFDHVDALRLLARPEPVILGIGESHARTDSEVAFSPGVTEVVLGAGAPGLYPLEYAGVGFCRVRAEVLRRMIAELDLPLCNTSRGLSLWPFFQPTAVRQAQGGVRYFASVETFYERLRQIGVTPLADTSLRLNMGGSTSPWACAASAWDQVPGMFDFQAVYDGAVAKAPDDAIFVEVGCLVGRSTCYLAMKIRESGKKTMLYAIDSARGSASDMTGQEIVPSLGGSLAGILHRNLIGCGVDEIVVPILTTSIRASYMFNNESIDFCFIDADHSYESVLADLHAWWPKIKPGGMLAGHDYRQSSPWLVGVTSAVHDFFGVEDATHGSVSWCWAISKSPSH